jgi:hypothetical protein
MTQLRHEQVSCPSCQKSQEVAIYDSINVDIDPDLKAKLLEGKINSFKCEHCGNDALINISFFYHDMTRNFCVQYYPLRLLDRQEFYDDFSIDGKLNISKRVAIMVENYLSEPHIVFNMQEMLSYIMFRERLYDHYSPKYRS